MLVFSLFIHNFALVRSERAPIPIMKMRLCIKSVSEILTESPTSKGGRGDASPRHHLSGR